MAVIAVSLGLIYLGPRLTPLTDFQTDVEEHCQKNAKFFSRSDCEQFLFAQSEYPKEINLYSTSSISADSYIPVKFVLDSKEYSPVGLRIKKAANLELIENTVVQERAFKFKFNFQQKLSLYGITEPVFSEVTDENEFLKKRLAHEIYKLFDVYQPRSAYYILKMNDKRLGLFELTEPLAQVSKNGFSETFKFFKLRLQRKNVADANIPLAPEYLRKYVMATLITGNLDDGFFSKDTAFLKKGGVFFPVPEFSILFKRPCEWLTSTEQGHFSNAVWVEGYQDLLGYIKIQSPEFRNALTQEINAFLDRKEFFEKARKMYSAILDEGRRYGFEEVTEKELFKTEVGAQVQCATRLLRHLARQEFNVNFKSFKDTYQDELKQ